MTSHVPNKGFEEKLTVIRRHRRNFFTSLVLFIPFVFVVMGIYELITHRQMNFLVPGLFVYVVICVLSF